MIILGFIFLASCEQVIEWQPQFTTEEKLVVEAIITDENKKQEIHLSTLLDSLNGIPSGVSDAFVMVENATESHLFWEDAEEKGKYLSQNAFKVYPGSIYKLTIDWKENKYEAWTTASDVLPMRNFSFPAYGETDSVYIAGIGVEYNDSEEAMYEFLIDWRHIIPGDSSLAKQVHYVFSSINIGQLFGPDKDQLYFPKGSIVFQRKYGLGDGYAEYLRSLVVETQWKGGLFEESNGNLPTNISNGGLGYFAACSVLNDTLIVE
jgi:hypothetical protein